MKRRRLRRDSRLKRRYNLVHRLRVQGVVVDTDTYAINCNPDDYDNLPRLAQRYIRALRDEYHFSVQTYIPDPQQVEIPIKFTRKKHRTV